MNIYVTTQGSRIVREGSHLLVKKGEDTHHTLFAAKLRQVVICGRVELTPAAVQLLLRHDIDTVFLTADGRYLGRFANMESKNVELRRRQFALLDQPEFGLDLCRRIVHGKITSQTILLMRITRTRNIRDAQVKAREIRALVPRLRDAASVDQVRGYEGRASAIYFQGIRHGFLQDWKFHRRVRRPPTDPVNAVLSLLYTFLFNRMYAAIRQVNLDPCPGFLHAPDYGRFALVMDLMEEFRTIVVDTLVLSLFNLKILRKDDFVEEYPEEPAITGEPAKPLDVAADRFGLMHEGSGPSFDLPPQRMNDIIGDDEPEDGRGRPAVKLVGEAFQRVVENFERKLCTEFRHPVEDRKMTYGEAMIAQAGQLRQVIEGSRKVYQPLILK